MLTLEKEKPVLWKVAVMVTSKQYLTHFENIKFSFNILCSRTLTFLDFIDTIKISELLKIVDTVFCVLNKN